jgi:hypothetical protein
MRALRLLRVKLVLVPNREPETQVSRREKSGDFADGVVERRIVIGHERSPFETTHNDLRLAFEALSGGLPFTIYAARFESVRIGTNKFSRVLTNTTGRTRRRGETASGKVGDGDGWRVERDAGKNGETRRAQTGVQLRG